MNKIWQDTVVVCRMIKIEHSIFALPFAYTGLFLASGGRPGWGAFVLLTIAMVAVRSFAMGVNRVVDLRFDRMNPRTQRRPLVTGELSVRFTLIFLAITALIFIAACAGLNLACFWLSFPALAWSGLYSFTKRFTPWCHFFLGSVLGLAPVAGWLAFDPVLTLPAVLLFCGVTCWVAGFDLLYACQDVEFDRKVGLYSMPALFGVETALAVSSFSHAITGAFFLLAGWAAGLGAIYFLVTGFCCAVLVWEHLLIKADDMSRVNMAFFTLNGGISMAIFGGVIWAIFA
ncbi:MAG: putative 4-hydroxybenzoate polyprenyltransferase [Proteobacteria bacterium]|nr:putative 4-hydroxybenzoate polyprenyltransferase [Pseudomonadota bacterium]MBU1611334.1 putative 4-hydroxybenzoate polyprenyltransferase [Pseudomonadota bacterium]